jgi:hypothetical protein
MGIRLRKERLKPVPLRPSLAQPEVGEDMCHGFRFRSA